MFVSVDVHFEASLLRRFRGTATYLNHYTIDA